MYGSWDVKMNEILELKGIKKAFGGVPVLNGIDLSVKPGEFITLLGSSGCGKTTTLRIISGLETPDSGTVLLEGADVTGTEPDKRGVHTVFQNYALFPHMTVEANIGYSLKIRGVKKTEIKSRVREMLELVQLEGFGGRMPGELSGGIGTFDLIVSNPPYVASMDILTLDSSVRDYEPLGALDLQLRRMMQTELKRLQKKLGITFIYITHDQEEALNMSDRIAVMRNGLFEQLGTPNEIYDRPKTAYVARFVGSANILTLGGKCLAVRSEALELNRGESGRLTGVIREKTFSGGMLRITVDTESCGELVASRHGIDSPLAPGETVGISWAEGAAVEVEP